MVESARPTELTHARLADVTTKIGSGATPRGGSTVYVDLGTAFIRSQNVRDNWFSVEGLAHITDAAAAQLSGVTVQEGDVLMNITGESILRCCVVPAEALPARVSQHVAIIRSDGSLLPEFIQSYLVNPSTKEHLLSLASGGATRKAITKSQIERIEIPVPPLGVQRAVAEVLGALDDKIAANTKTEAILTTLFQTTFLKCVDPMSARVALGEIVQTNKGVSYRSADLIPSSTALVTLKSIQRDGGYSKRGLKPYAGPYSEAQVIKPGEIVIAQTDLTQAADVVGRAVQVRGSDEYRALVASLDLVVVRPRGELPREFLLGLLMDGAFREHCRARTSGTTVLHLAPDAITTYMAPAVPPDLQERFAWVARPILAMRDSLANERHRLGSLRDALLPALMSGRLQVRDAEREVESAI